MIVVGIRFKTAGKIYYFDPTEIPLAEEDGVIVETARGMEFGTVAIAPRSVAASEVVQPLKPIIRKATPKDLRQVERNKEREKKAFTICLEKIAKHKLPMKLIDVDYTFDMGKIIFFFTADGRIDFRELVRDLASVFRTRIELRQIGLRDEAKMIGGVGYCGRPLCCASFLGDFKPVSIRMAKGQGLSLNPTKISGICGRLMCCLRYEFEAYRDFKGRAPKRNAVIETPLGKAKIVEYDTPKEEICLRLENGKQVRVPLAEMTASDAAVKKSKDLGCACRPDTVTRDVLERLQSPDVRMALAELDRANGVTPPEGFDDADLFVQPKRRRRRSGDGGDAAGGAEKRPAAGAPSPYAAGAEGEQQPARRRHRKGRTARVELAAEEFEVTVTSGVEPDADAPKPMRRRRHHRVAGGTNAPAGAEGGESQGRGSGAEKGAGAGQAQGGQQRRRTRHPGDRGGAAAQGSRPAPKHMAPAEGAAGQSAAGQAAGGDGAAPKRRRRHRGGRGRRGGEGGANGGSAGGSTPAPAGE